MATGLSACAFAAGFAAAGLAGCCARQVPQTKRATTAALSRNREQRSPKLELNQHSPVSPMIGREVPIPEAKRVAFATLLSVRDRPVLGYTSSGTTSRATILMILISGFTAGPAVSL